MDVRQAFEEQFHNARDVAGHEQLAVRGYAQAVPRRELRDAGRGEPLAAIEG